MIDAFINSCLFLLSRNNVGQNGTQWKRFSQLLPEFERGSFEDCCHCHLVRVERKQHQNKVTKLNKSKSNEMSSFADTGNDDKN